MFSIKKDHVLGSALPLNLYNKLVYTAGEKNMSLSEIILLSVAMQLSNSNIDVPKAEKTSEQKKIVTVRASAGLVKLVDKVAKEHECSKSRYISAALDEGLNYVKKG